MRRHSPLSFALLVPAAAVGCKDDSSAAPTQKVADQPIQLAGVYPENWRCESIAALDVLGAALGGTVKPMDSAISVNRGLPHPCNYELTTQTNELEYWTFDLDCRDGMKQRADALFAQYKEQSEELVEAYKASLDAGPHAAKQPKPAPGIDAPPPQRAPEGAAEVAVGAKGLDHHGQGLIFIDDDAPCYVRVVGPDATRRLDLARLLAKNLTFANAPMTPRPFK